MIFIHLRILSIRLTSTKEHEIILEGVLILFEKIVAIKVDKATIFENRSNEGFKYK
jgi:hypothetical protein